MNFINVLKKLVIKSQLYVSFCATLLGIFVLQEQESYQSLVAIVVFLTFWNGYIFTVYHKKKDAISINLVGFAVISFLIFKFLNLEFFIKWLIILALGILYNSDILNINIREFWLVKTFYVGLVWAMSLVWLPLENFNLEWFITIFLFISAITFPFEIRDLERDKFPTLPKVIGIKNTKILSIIFLLLSGTSAIIYFQKNFAISFVLSVTVSIISVTFSHKKRDDLYYSFFLESLSVLPFLILILLKYFC